MLKTLKRFYQKKAENDKNSPKPTYAQSGEDVIIDHIFRSMDISSPSYIDVGAHHPYYLNNTAIFYERGCRGINVEPDPKLFIKFEQHRKHDINLNIGISTEPGTLDFFILSTPTLNTFSEEEANRIMKETNYKISDRVKIKVDTVDNIINQYHNGKFPDLLSLDVEGLDEKILKSIDYNKNRPSVICVETLTFSDKKQGIKMEGIIEFLQHQNYFLYADTYINSIFVDKNKWKR